MQRLEVSGAIRPIYGSLGVKRLINTVSMSVFYVKVKVKFTLEQATKDQRGNRGIALLFFEPPRYHATLRPLYPREREPVPIV